MFSFSLVPTLQLVVYTHESCHEFCFCKKLRRKILYPYYIGGYLHLCDISMTTATTWCQWLHITKSWYVMYLIRVNWYDLQQDQMVGGLYRQLDASTNINIFLRTSQNIWIQVFPPKKALSLLLQAQHEQSHCTMMGYLPPLIPHHTSPLQKLPALLSCSNQSR